MSGTRTIVVVGAAALLAVAALALTVHLRWLPVDVALWIAMFVVFMSSQVLRPALQARKDERRDPR
ncbi:MAG: hypothetical protein ACXWKD_08145 [Caldimonas sp.]